MVCGESPQPHATVSQAIFQNGEERKVIKGKSISKATRLPKFHSDFPGARQQERRGWLALDPPLAPAQSPSALPGDAEGLSAFSGAWGGVQLRGFARGSSRRHIPRTRGVPSAHPGRGASLPPSLPRSAGKGAHRRTALARRGTLVACSAAAAPPSRREPHPRGLLHAWAAPRPAPGSAPSGRRVGGARALGELIMGTGEPGVRLCGRGATQTSARTAGLIIYLTRPLNNSCQPRSGTTMAGARQRRHRAATSGADVRSR